MSRDLGPRRFARINLSRNRASWLMVVLTIFISVFLQCLFFGLAAASVGALSEAIAGWTVVVFVSTSLMLSLTIATTLFVMIYEREKTLGVLRSLGVRREHAARLLLLETIPATIIGYLLGAASATFLGLGLDSNYAGSISLFSAPYQPSLIFLLPLVISFVSSIVPIIAATRSIWDKPVLEVMHRA